MALAYASQPPALCPNTVSMPNNASALLSYTSRAQRAAYVERVDLEASGRDACLSGREGVQAYVVFSAHVYGGMSTIERQLVQYMQSAGAHIAFNNELAENGSRLDEAARELGRLRGAMVPRQCAELALGIHRLALEKELASGQSAEAVAAAVLYMAACSRR